MKATMMQGFAAALLAGTLLLAGCGGSQASTTQTTDSKSTEKTEQTQSTEKTEQTQTQKTTDEQSSKQQGTQESTQTTEPAKSETTSAAPAASSSQSNYIGEDAAKAAALADAGLAESDVTELKCSLDTDEAVVHYDVEFKHGGKEYDYDVDPVTAAVLKHDSEIDD